ncbi:MAG TPA: restriction endonuclease [Terriglobales bacterium]|jgi:site-specific DNA-methyltransferase (cytosine-N4-specific)
MESIEKRLPFAGEFSPGQVDLRRVLELASQSDSEKSFAEAVRTEYFADSCESYKGEKRHIQQTKRAKNVLLGMRAYRLLDSGFLLTPIGSELLRLDKRSAYRHFAAHIITEVHGQNVLGAVDRLYTKGDRVGKASISLELRRSGYIMPTATTAHLILLKWLREAGLFLKDKSYELNRTVLSEILGTTQTILTDLDGLSHNERIFLLALTKLITDETKSLKVSDVMEYAQNLLNLKVREDQWRSKLLDPLSKAGWIALESGTSGRGAKSGRVTPTEVFKSQYLAPLLQQQESEMPQELRKGLNRSFDKILAEMASEDTYIKGTALEHLAGRITQLLDLKPKHLRLRSSMTGGTEVDLIAESTRLIFSRWQVQCKNTKTLAADDVAKEVGIAVSLRSQVILMVTTGRAGKVVYQYGRKINETTAMQVIVLDGKDLQEVAKDSSAAGVTLTKILDSRAEQVMQHKAVQLNLPEY